MSLTRRAAMRGCVCTCARASSEAAAQHEREKVVACKQYEWRERDPPGSGRTSRARSLIRSCRSQTVVACRGCGWPRPGHVTMELTTPPPTNSPRLSAPRARARRQARTPSEVSHLRLPHTPRAGRNLIDIEARHQRSGASECTGSIASRLLHRRPIYHPLPAGCVCAAAGFLAPMPRFGCACAAGFRPPPCADRPAALEASERRATRYIRGLRTKRIWGTMGVRHGAHTDTRAQLQEPRAGAAHLL